MARYRVTELSYINNTIVEAGTEVEYDGRPSSNLEPIDKPAKAAVKAAAEMSQEEKEARQNLAANEANPDAPAPDAEKLKALSAAANAPDLPPAEEPEALA